MFPISIRKNFYTTSSAFSLLEMLFVILVLSAITMSFVSYSRQHASQVLIDKTVQQYEQWRSAVKFYNVVEQRWPATLSDVIKKGYIAEENLCSVWPIAKGEKSAPDCHSKSQFVGELSPSQQYVPNYKISLTFPNEQVADLVANQVSSTFAAANSDNTIEMLITPLSIKTQVMQQLSDTPNRIYRIGTPVTHLNGKALTSYTNKGAIYNTVWKGNRLDTTSYPDQVMPPSCPAGYDAVIFATIGSFIQFSESANLTQYRQSSGFSDDCALIGEIGLNILTTTSPITNQAVWQLVPYRYYADDAVPSPQHYPLGNLNKRSCTVADPSGSYLFNAFTTDPSASIFASNSASVNYFTACMPKTITAWSDKTKTSNISVNNETYAAQWLGSTFFSAAPQTCGNGVNQAQNLPCIHHLPPLYLSP